MQQNRVQSHSDRYVGSYTPKVTSQSNGGKTHCLMHGAGEKENWVLTTTNGCFKKDEN